MSVKKKVTYVSDEGFEFTHEPVDGTLKIKKTEGGFEARYLTPDDDIQSPDSWADDGLFLVHYHRDFDVRRDVVVTQDQLVGLLKAEADSLPGYWIFWTKAYIHSGVHLALSSGGFDCDPGGWDTSHCGAVLASKKEFRKRATAEKAALSLIEAWNQYLSGDVYGLVIEQFDKDRCLVHTSATWGYYGEKYALEELEAL